MSGTTAGLIGLAIMLVLMFANVNLAFTFMISGFLGVSLMMGLKGALTFLQTIPVNAAMIYSLSVIPLFMLMGDIAVDGRLTTDAYGTARSFLGRIHGGQAITSTTASAIFGAICGSGQATAMVMSQIAWPEMKKYGYNKQMGLASIAAAGPLAILIPPSTPLITYGILSETSVGKLFMAGWIPGIILTIALCMTTYIMCRIDPKKAPLADKMTWKDKLKSLVGAWPILLLVVVMMICIWGGITTVSEAAGAAVIICIIIVFAKRRLTVKQMARTIRNSAVMGSGLFFMFVGINLFNSFLGLSQLPAKLAAFVTGLNVSPMVVIWAIVIAYLILGCFIDTPVIMMLTIPLFAPTVSALGFSLVWFGILSTMTVALGSITPPVGICLFVIAARIKDCRLSDLYKGIWPYIIATFAVTVLVMYFPILSTWLPGLMQ